MPEQGKLIRLQLGNMKKLFLLLLMIQISLMGFSTNYYVSNSGNDSNNGTSITTTWLTLSKVNSVTFAAGDSVLFKRGDSFYGQLLPKSGTASGDVIYSSYGTGVYCMGDSQTSYDYPPLLQTYLGNQYKIVDRGVGGNTTAQMLARFATDVTNYNDVDYVIIMGGTNDAWVGVDSNPIDINITKSNLQAMYDAAHAKGAKVIAMTITPNSADNTIRTPWKTELNNWIKSKPNNVDFVVDTYAAMNDPNNPGRLRPEDTIDGIHYTATGNQRILATINSVVTFLKIGTKPLLHQSVLENSTSDWAEESSNVWKTTGTYTLDVGNVIFGNDASVGIKKWNKTDLNTQGFYWYDAANDLVYLYSVSNPATFYTSTRLCIKSNIIYMNPASYVTIKNLSTKYGADGGIFYINSDHITISDCDIAWLGGGDFGAPTRLGGGIGSYASTTNILVENCRIWECFDNGISNQYDGTATHHQYNIIYRNNQIWNCEYSFEYFNRSTNGSTHDVSFINNTCYNAGGGWGHAQRYDPTGYHLRLAGTPTNTYNFVIENNIFHTATSAIHRNWDSSGKYTIDYNDYYQPSGNYAYANTTTYSSFSTYKTATGWDAHSINSNPLLTNVSASIFTQTSNSPTIDAGVNVGLPYLGTAPDMGYLEYNGPGGNTGIWNKARVLPNGKVMINSRNGYRPMVKQ